MRYDISKQSAPKMPTLGKGTECIQILLSQASKDMHEPLVPMLFLILGAHLSGAEFQYCDNKLSSSHVKVRNFTRQLCQLYKRK